MVKRGQTFAAENCSLNYQARQIFFSLRSGFLPERWRGYQDFPPDRNATTILSDAQSLWLRSSVGEERLPHKEKGSGSIPLAATKKLLRDSQVVRRSTVNRVIVGSIPTLSANIVANADETTFLKTIVSSFLVAKICLRSATGRAPVFQTGDSGFESHRRLQV